MQRPNPRESIVAASRTRPIPLEDLELIEKVKAGEAEAYGKLVEKYQDRVFNACWRICGHLEDARDITQEAFLKAFEGLPTFRQQSGFFTWIFRIAVNLALSHRRKEKNRKAVSLESLTPVGAQADDLIECQRQRRDKGPMDSMADAELQRRLVQALHGLEEDHRAVVVLRDMEEFDYREIAEILDIPPGTVKSRLHRARLALREAISPFLSQYS